jgi:decaprenylphospho-beta-D-erythro-pentofuranosid-2-ulose 2-reductase
MEKFVILGATSEIAQQVQRILAKAGKEFLLVGRSAEHLETVAADLHVRGAKTAFTLQADLADVSQHPRIIALVEEHFADFECVLLAYGTMQDQKECRHSVEMSLREWDSNFVSAAALLTLFADIFERRKSGCIAAITSVAGDRGRSSNYVYGAAKGALSLFLEGLRGRLHASNVRVLTIKPGPVKTPMTVGLAQYRRFADAASVAKDICRTLENGSRDILYTPWYWRYVMTGVRLIPEGIFKKISI